MNPEISGKQKTEMFTSSETRVCNIPVVSDYLLPPTNRLTARYKNIQNIHTPTLSVLDNQFLCIK